MRGAGFCPEAMLMICRKMCPRTHRQILYCLVTLQLQFVFVYHLLFCSKIIRIYTFLLELFPLRCTTWYPL